MIVVRRIMSYFGLLCISIYSPHRYPVTKLLIPAQNKAGASAIFRSRASATVKGINVPRSPREPEISGSDVFHNYGQIKREDIATSVSICGLQRSNDNL